MKYIVAGFLSALTLTISTTAAAGGYYGHRHHYHHRPHVVHHHGHWIAPLIIGGVVGAAIAANRVEAQTQAPVVNVPGSPATVVQDNLGNTMVQCPTGLMPVEYQGWVKNQWGQYVQTNFVRCQ